MRALMKEAARAHALPLLRDFLASPHFPEPNMNEVMAFLATTDGARARKFFEEVVRLRFVEDSPWALVFQSGPPCCAFKR